MGGFDEAEAAKEPSQAGHWTIDVCGRKYVRFDEDFHAAAVAIRWKKMSIETATDPVLVKVARKRTVSSGNENNINNVLVAIMSRPNENDLANFHTRLKD